MNIEYNKLAVKFLNKADKDAQQAIRSHISGLLKIPPIGDIKPLQGKHNIYRLRIGKYRLLFSYKERVGEKVLYIENIGTRGDIYK